MSAISYLKCSCQQCGRHIEFPADAIGTSVDCPHCGWPTELTLPAPPELSAPSPRNLTWPVIGLCVLLFGMIASFVGLRMVKQLALKNRSGKSGALAAKSTNNLAKTGSPAATAASISTNDFIVAGITLEKAKDSNFVYVIGSVKNETDRQRFGVRVDLDLFDQAGDKVGRTSDYRQTLAPEAEWHFKALVFQSSAATATLASIKEE
jgi:hypothetical protein